MTAPDGYETALCGEVHPRDGWAFDIRRLGPWLNRDPSRGIPTRRMFEIAEVFEDDATKVRTFRAFTTDPQPLEVIEYLVEQARIRI